MGKDGLQKALRVSINPGKWLGIDSTKHMQDAAKLGGTYMGFRPDKDGIISVYYDLSESNRSSVTDSKYFAKILGVDKKLVKIVSLEKAEESLWCGKEKMGKIVCKNGEEYSVDAKQGEKILEK
jgi:hypothetical protein